MKKALLAGAALAALVSAPALAADAVSPVYYPTAAPAVSGIQGYMGAGGAMLSGFGSTVNVVAVGGALNIPFGGLNLELEGAGSQINVSGGPSFSYSKGYVHAFLRSSGMAVGAFGGFEATAIGGSGLWNLGAEAQAYLGNINLYGQVAAQTFTNGGPTGWNARGSAQLFFTDNVLVQADVRYTSAFVMTGTPAWTFGGTAEARFNGTPWAVFATARRTTVSGGGGAINTGLIGVKAHVGDGTLMQQNTTGASMNVIPLL